VRVGPPIGGEEVLRVIFYIIPRARGAANDENEWILFPFISLWLVVVGSAHPTLHLDFVGSASPPTAFAFCGHGPWIRIYSLFFLGLDGAWWGSAHPTLFMTC
jgi:hypothetical protein